MPWLSSLPFVFWYSWKNIPVDFFRFTPLLKNNDFFTRKLTLGTFIRIKWFDIDPNIRSGVDNGVLADPEQIYNEMFQKLCLVQTLELEPGSSQIYLSFKKGFA